MYREMTRDSSNYSRVHVHGVRGAPPPPTTKWAIFYHGGFECQILVNAAGYATDKKWDLFEKQIRYFLGEEKIKELKILQFQRYAKRSLWVGLRN